MKGPGERGRIRRLATPLAVQWGAVLPERVSILGGPAGPTLDTVWLELRTSASAAAGGCGTWSSPNRRRDSGRGWAVFLTFTSPGLQRHPFSRHLILRNIPVQVHGHFPVLALF